MMHRVLKRILPRRLQPSWRARQFITRSTEGGVFSGPFAGMTFPQGDAPAKYLLGTYELELHPLLRQISATSFDRIIDVGAETGYYAVGLALLHPEAQIFAFEADERFHPALRALARTNHVEDRVRIGGLCAPQDLAGRVKGSDRCLVFMDCEGGEKQLLHPCEIPELKRCHILVELHDFVFRDIAEILALRFQSTHRVTEIWSRPRTIADFPLPAPPSLKSRFYQKYYVSAMNEGRPEPMRWRYLEPK